MFVVCPALDQILTSTYFLAGLVGPQSLKMSRDEIIRVSYDILPPDYKELVAKYIEEYQLKCLEAFNKTRNKLIMKGSLLKVAETEDTEVEKKMFKDVIHEAVHHALFNQLGVLMNTIKNIRSDVITSAAPEQTISPSYFNVQASG